MPPGRARGQSGPDARVSHSLPLCFCSKSYSAHAAYAQSKLALVFFTYHLQALLEATGSPVTANVADPGVVDTDLYRHVFWGTRLIKKLFGWCLFKVRLRRSGVSLWLVRCEPTCAGFGFAFPKRPGFLCSCPGGPQDDEVPLPR